MTSTPSTKVIDRPEFWKYITIIVASTATLLGSFIAYAGSKMLDAVSQIEPIQRDITDLKTTKTEQQVIIRTIDNTTSNLSNVRHDLGKVNEQTQKILDQVTDLRVVTAQVDEIRMFMQSNITLKSTVDAMQARMDKMQDTQSKLSHDITKLMSSLDSLDKRLSKLEPK